MSEKSAEFHYSRALVTGAGSGIGSKLCELLDAGGCKVWGVSRDKRRVPPVATPVELDLANPSALRSFVESGMPEIAPDILVNCAGCGVFGDIDEQSESDIRAQIDVMLAAPALLCLAAIPAMKEAKRGCIANVSSMAAEFPLPCMPVYNAAKSGLSALGETLASELESFGICVIDFRPGDFSSGFFKATRRVGGSDRAWAASEKHLEGAPDSEWMARKLLHAIAKGKSGKIRAGTFFQTRLAPFGAKVLPEAAFSRLKNRYLG